MIGVPGLRWAGAPIVHRTKILILGVISALQLVGCAGHDTSSPDKGVAVPLPLGGFIPSVGMADVHGSPAIPVDNPALWLPQSAVPMEGWGVPGRGWYPVGERSTLRLWRRTAGESSLGLDLTHRKDAPQEEFQLSVSLNGRRLGTFATAPGRVRQRFSLPSGLLEEVNDLELSIQPAVGLTEGPPSLTLLRVGLLGGGAGSRSQREDPGFDRTESGTIVFTRPGVFVIPMDIPTSAVQMEVRARNEGESLATHRLSVQRASGERIELSSGQLTGREWQRSRASIEAFRGERVVATWELELAGNGGRVELGEIAVSTGPEVERPREPVAESRRPGDRRPDVLLIILDAARGDRFPGWGYSRQTVPTIEELGARSLSFRYAFSECPTTSCSVPGMITGVPFLPGGEVGGGQQLADEVTTLAEYLAKLGYHTVGFSATPNNSASRNLDQGFEVFRELWGRDNPDHGPFNMSRLATEIIRGHPADQPLFLQLHYLPPHQPYDPAPEFDRFTDPGYIGPIRPDMSLKPYSLGLEKMENRDLEHLIGLYDGNLSVADAAVGQVLEALRSTGRFDNSLIVITSDHGEAFMEHGRQGHNTTLFDEMLHVPLLVKLPHDESPESIDLDRLASVLDIVPTVLGYLDAIPEPQMGGLDLLRSQPDPLRPRTLFFRTSHPKNTMLAARTPAWKAISWPRHQVQMLFDLVRDPEEMVNRVGEQPFLYAGLGLRIRHHLKQSGNLRAPGEEIELTAEERDALRALGYLD